MRGRNIYETLGIFIIQQYASNLPTQPPFHFPVQPEDS